MPTQNAAVRAMANGYTLAYFDRPMADTGYARVNVPHAEAVAVAYNQELRHTPHDAATVRAYTSLGVELEWQWHWAVSFGYQLLPWDHDGQPYANSAEMRADVADNKRLYFFRGGDAPQDHILMQTCESTGYTYNEMLRAVHDLFGHAQGGFDFGARGEENAYREHRKMFSALALPALTTETRGQNSWVNFGPFRGIPAAERPFAEQKCGLLPAWCWQRD